MRTPLATSIETRDGSLSKDAKLVNAFVDVQGDTSFIVKRPGLRKTVATASGAGLGMVSWEGNMYSATGATIYQTSYASIPSGTGGGSSSMTLQSSPASMAAHAMAKIGTTLYVIDEGTTNKLHASTDSGVTWSSIDSDTPGYFGTCPLYGGKGIFSDGTDLYGIDAYGDALRSVNGGVTWTNIGTPNYTNQAFIFHDGTQWVQIGGSSSTSVGASSDFITFSNFNAGANCPKTTGSIVFVGGKYFGLSGTQGSLVYATALNSWSVQAGFGWLNSENVTLHTDGTSLFLFRHNTSSNTLTVSSINPATLAAQTIYTGTYSSVAAGPSSRYGQKIGSDIIIFNGSVDGYSPPSTVYKFTAAGNAWTTPGSSYSFTTTTPGLRFSWVGTSPGTTNPNKKLFIKNTERAWVLTLGTPGTLAQVTDADYPALTVPGAVYLDGYFFVMDKDGTVFNSDLENPASWNALNYITAEAEWDKGVAIAKHQNYVMALKDWTTELFYDAANPTGSPLAKLQNATIQLGCAQGYSVVQFHGGLAFMSKTRERGRSVHFFPAEGIAPQEIASPAVQRVLNAADLTSVSAWGGKIAGRVLYVLNLVTAGVSLVYDFTTQVWSQWTSDTSGTEGHFLCGFYATDGTRDYVMHESTGDIFNLTPDAYQDNGANIKVLCRTGRLDGGNLDRKTMRALTVVGDQAATSVNVQYSDDDYQTFSSARTVSMNDNPPRLLRLGMFRRRSFDIRHVDNTPLRLVALDAEMEQAR